MNKTQIKKKDYTDGFLDGYNEAAALMEEVRKDEIARITRAEASPHLRDSLAAKAMQFELTRLQDALTDPDCDFVDWEGVQEQIAGYAYTMADAMLKERGK